MSKKLTPAELVVARFAEQEVSIHGIARGLDIAHSGIVRWRQRPDGLIPSKHHAGLLALAKSERVKLKAEELVVGGVV